MVKYFLLIISTMFLMACNSMKGFELLYRHDGYGDSLKMMVYQKEAVGFGPQAIKIFIIEPNGKKQLILEDKIYNDGVTLQDKNVGIKLLTNQRAEISIRGKEMGTKKYLVTKINNKYKVEPIE